MTAPDGLGSDTVCQAHPSVPVVRQIPVDIGSTERSRLARIAARLHAEEPALSTTDAFGPRVTAGLGEGPALLIGDHSEIALTSASDVSVLEYRILFLGGEGDLLAIGGDRHLAFERYCAETLGLGRVGVLTPVSTWPGKRLPLATRCARHPETLDRIVSVAREHACMNILPHIGTGSAWALAAKVSEASGAEVRVGAAPPRLTKRINDKLWFAELVAAVLGEHSLPPLAAVFGPAALAARVAALARRNARVVIKVPDSAGSAGNLTMESKDLLQMPMGDLRHRLIDLLQALGWGQEYPLLVEVWDCPVVSSPSVQIWVPERETGLPVVEGLFEQVVEGEAGEFVGAVPARLTERWSFRLAEEASRLANLLQVLGYFGRCSFDAVLAGEDVSSGKLHWIECNGRWGGVSVPMTLVNRLTGNWRDSPFVVVQHTNINIRPQSFVSAVERLHDHLYRPGRSKQGVVVLTPGGIERGVAIHLMAIAETLAAARDQARAASSILLTG